jgi:acyl-CoA dehydrogenase
VSNLAAALFGGLTGARHVGVPGAPELKRYYQQLTRMSAGFAFVADISMLVLGGNLKRKEKLSGRLGDIVSQLYLASATVKRFEDEGRQKADLPLVHWALQDALHRIQEAFYGVFENFPNPLLASMMRFIVFPAGRVFPAPSDRLGTEISRLMMQVSEARDRLTSNTFVWRKEDDPVGCLELALEAAREGEQAEQKLRSLVKAGNVVGDTENEQLDQAVACGEMTDVEAGALRRFQALRRNCIMVDDFPPDVGRNASKGASVHTTMAARDGTYDG